MIAWIAGLAFFAAWGAFLAWKYVPHVGGYIISSRLTGRSKTVEILIVLICFAIAFLGVFLSHMLIYWLMITIFSSSVLKSGPFYIISLFLTAVVFGVMFVSLLLWYERKRGSEGLKNIIAEAIDEAKQKD